MVDSYSVRDAHKDYVSGFIGGNTPLLKLVIYDFCLVYFVLRFVYIIDSHTNGALVSPSAHYVFCFF